MDHLLSRGWIKSRISQYNHPILFAKKKDGTLRMCINYCIIKYNLVGNHYPLPRINHILDFLDGSIVYSNLYLVIGYHQLAIEPTHTY